MEVKFGFVYTSLHNTSVQHNWMRSVMQTTRIGKCDERIMRWEVARACTLVILGWYTTTCSEIIVIKFQTDFLHNMIFSKLRTLGN